VSVSAAQGSFGAAVATSTATVFVSAATYAGASLGFVEATTIYTSWTATTIYTSWTATTIYTSWTARGVMA
jgi:multisubunit Na+/H+ antiporter MnhG subunit